MKELNDTIFQIKNKFKFVRNNFKTNINEKNSVCPDLYRFLFFM